MGLSIQGSLLLNITRSIVTTKNKLYLNWIFIRYNAIKCLGERCDLLSFARPLEGIYMFWLQRHCDTFYLSSPQRAQQIVAFLDSLVVNADSSSLLAEFNIHPSLIIQKFFNKFNQQHSKWWILRGRYEINIDHAMDEVDTKEDSHKLRLFCINLNNSTPIIA